LLKYNTIKHFIPAAKKHLPEKFETCVVNHFRQIYSKFRQNPKNDIGLDFVNLKNLINIDLLDNAHGQHDVSIDKSDNYRLKGLKLACCVVLRFSVGMKNFILDEKVKIL